MPSRLQLLVVFWGTGAAGIFLMQGLLAGDRLTLVVAMALALVACLGATAARWIPASQRLVAAMCARIGPTPRATSERTSPSIR
jgi:hypothetical protein